jgi:hypothetical protein
VDDRQSTYLTKLPKKKERKNPYVLTLPTPKPKWQGEKKNGVKTHSRKPGELKETKS